MLNIDKSKPVEALGTTKLTLKGNRSYVDRIVLEESKNTSAQAVEIPQESVVSEPNILFEIY